MATVTGSKRHLDITSDTLTTSSNVDVGAKLFITTTDTNTTSTSALVLNSTEVETRTLGSLAFSSATYDNYVSWNLKTNDTQRTTVGSGGDLNIVAGTNVGVAYSAGGTVTITSTDTTYSAGTLLDISGTTFNVDLSELTNNTAAFAPTQDHFVILDNGVQGKKLASSIFGSAAYEASTAFATASHNHAGVYAPEYENLSQASGAEHDMHHWRKVHASYSNNSGNLTYLVIQTEVPQDNYSMGGFTLVYQEDYYNSGEGGEIRIYGYWNPESNGGFEGFRYECSNPYHTPTIEVCRNSSSGNTAFFISGEGGNYAQLIAKDLWLGYTASSATSQWGNGWVISEASDKTGYTNFNTLNRNDFPAITTDGSTPSLTGGVDAAEIRTLIGAPSTSVATTSANGLMSSTDKSKLDGIESSADVTDATNVAAAGALMTSGGTMTGGLTISADLAVTGNIKDNDYKHAGSDLWLTKKYVRSLGISGGDIANSWVHLSRVAIASSYGKLTVKFTIHGYDDVSSGTEIIDAIYENGNSAQENHGCQWYSTDNNANLFKNVRSIRSSSSGTDNVYDIYVQMAGDWRDTFTVVAEYWRTGTNQSITFPTSVASSSEPGAGSNDIELTDRRWYTENTYMYLGANRVYTTGDFTNNSSNWDTAYNWGNHASAGYLTAHPSITEAADVDNSGGTVIQDLTFDDNGHVTATGSVNLDNIYTSTDGTENDYRFKLNLSNFSGTRWYKVATVNIGSGGLRIRGMMTNHVESFGSNMIDIAIQGREGNNSDEIEVTGHVHVLHENAGIAIYSGEKPGSYRYWDVYVVATQYTQCQLDLTKVSGSFDTSGNYVTTEPSGTLELETYQLSEGNYVIRDSAAKRIFDAGINLAGGLSYTPSTNTLTQTDNNTTYSVATTSANGLMSSTDKSKLDGIESGADVTDSSNVATAGALMATGGILSGTVKVTGSIIYENDADSGYIPFPKGAQYQTKTNSHTGAIKITLPTHGGDDMVKWVVDIYDYGNGESVTMFMGGYLYQATGGNEWVNCTVTTLTEHSDKDYTVRFGADGTNSCVWIGETNSTWSYPQVVVRDFVGGFITDIDAYDDNWSISFVTSFDTVDETISDNLPTADWDRIEGKPTEFTPASHTHSAATTSANGFMSSADKTKLDGIETSADVTDATNVAAAGALMTSGGTITGDLTVNGKFVISGVVDREEWGRSYTVSNTNIQNLLDSAGNALADGGAYRVVGHIDGTGTDQASSAVFWNQNGTWYVNVTGQSGTSSNHIQFLVNGGKPAVKTYHANDYTVRVSHERLALEEGTGTDNARYYFGADSYMSDIAGTLKFQGTHNIWHAGNSDAFTSADHTKLDGIASGAEVNVQADWNEATTTSDAYIKNKPTLGTAAASAATDFISATNADTAAELITFAKGTTTDGHSKFYNWRALDNTVDTSNSYWRIARITSSQSSRFMITLAGRSSSYGDGALPAMGHIVGQLNNDNNYDVVFYNHSTASSEVVSEVGIVNVSNTVVDVYIKAAQFAELTATGHISDGSFAVYSNSGADGSTTVSGYTAVTEYTVMNTGNSDVLYKSGGTMSGDILLGTNSIAADTTSPTAHIQVGAGTTNTGSRSDVALLGEANSGGVVHALGLVNTAAGTNSNGVALNFHNGNAWSPTGQIIVQQDATGTVTNSAMKFYTYSGGLNHRMSIKSDGTIRFNAYGAGLIASDANGNLSVDTSTYLTGIAANSIGITELNVADGSAGQVLTTNGNGTLSFTTVSSGGTYTLPAATSSALGGIKIGYTANAKNYPVQLDASNKAYVNVPWTDANTTYTAGSGLDLNSNSFSVEADLRDGITHVGVSTNNYITFDNTNNHIDFYAGGAHVARMESDGDLHIKGDVIAFSSLFA